MTPGTNTTHTRRIARKVKTIASVAAVLAVGVLVGRLSLRWIAPASSPAATNKAPEQLYTCGMHPNVIQKGPGNCPICGMKLTPVRSSPNDSRPASSERRILYWRAPMNPSYTSDKPGKSPMGMDLVPVYAEGDGSESTHVIQIDPVTVQNMGIRTGTVKEAPLIKSIRTVGRVDYNEQTVTYVDTKFDGWIEKLFADETGVQVEKGQQLFSVYSPKLYSAQEEFVAALRGVERMAGSTFPEARQDAGRLAEASRTQLRYLDVSDDQIDQLQRTKEIQKTLTIHSPARGIVTEKMALEGMYVSSGMRLYTIADLSRVWTYVDIYEYQLPWVKIGQRTEMSLPYVPGRRFVGQVVYIYPYLEKSSRVIKVRLEFENPTLELKPGMYANVDLEADLGRHALMIPREGFIDSGLRKVAFVDLGGGRFMPRDIRVGIEGEDGMTEVLEGLSEGETIVTSGQFLLDAESKLKEAVAKMREPKGPKGVAGASSAPATQMDHVSRGHAAAHTASEPTSSPADGAEYVCPMHPEKTRSRHPGICSICAMKLVLAESLSPPDTASATIVLQMNYIMEHYLEIRRRFASDTTANLAQNALGLVAAADAIEARSSEPGTKLPPEFLEALRRLRANSALIAGTDIEKDRAGFAELSAALNTMVEHVRPSREVYPVIYRFHCPMSKGDWLQTAKEIGNPYYGFKMLDCGKLVQTK